MRLKNNFQFKILIVHEGLKITFSLYSWPESVVLMNQTIRAVPYESLGTNKRPVGSCQKWSQAITGVVAYQSFA